MHLNGSSLLVDPLAKDSNLGRGPLTVPLVEATAAPIYVQIAGRARHLRELGMTQ